MNAVHQAQVVQAIRARRAQKKPRNRRRLPRQLPPTTVQLEYAKAIISRVLAPARAALIAITPQLQHLIDTAARQDDDEAKKAGELVEETARGMADSFRPRALEDLAQTFAARTASFNDAQLGAQVRAGIGADVPLTQDLRAQVSAFTAENVALIRSIPSVYFGQIEQIVTRGAAAGVRWEDLAAQIQQRYEVAESRARLIARDQVGKFYGVVNQTRQEDLGITSYVWRTVQDERVRDNHVDLEGESCDWDDPPEGGGTDEDEPGHPGSGINCRCFAEPDFSDILDEGEPREATGRMTGEEEAPELEQEEAPEEPEETEQAAGGAAGLAAFGQAIGGALSAEAGGEALGAIGETFAGIEQAKAAGALGEVGAAIGQAASAKQAALSKLGELAEEKTQILKKHGPNALEVAGVNDKIIAHVTANLAAFAPGEINSILLPAEEKGLKSHKASLAAKKGAATKAANRAAAAAQASAAPIPAPSVALGAELQPGERLTANHIPVHEMGGYDGKALRIDADVLENHDMSIRRVVGLDGKTYHEVEFHVNSFHASQMKTGLVDLGRGGAPAATTWDYRARDLVGGMLQDAQRPGVPGVSALTRTIAAGEVAGAPAFTVDLGTRGCVDGKVRIRVAADDSAKTLGVIEHVVERIGGADTVLRGPEALLLELQAKAKIAAKIDPPAYALQHERLSPAAIERKYQSVAAVEPLAAKILADATPAETFKGHHAMFSQALADAATSGAKPVLGLFHDSSAGPDVIASMLGPSGLRANHARLSAGIFQRGQSSGTDLSTGGSDGFFTRVAKDAQQLRVRGGRFRLVIEPSELGRLDWWAFKFDNYGQSSFEMKVGSDHQPRSGYEKRWPLRDIISGVVDRITHRGNEIIFQKGIDASKVRKVIASPVDRAALIQELKSRGVHVLNGKPVEDFIEER